MWLLAVNASTYMQEVGCQVYQEGLVTWPAAAPSLPPRNDE